MFFQIPFDGSDVPLSSDESSNGDDVEAGAQRLERLMGEKSLHCRVAVGYEACHLILAVSLGNICDVYATRGVLGSLQRDVWRDVLLADMPYEDVRRHHYMRQRRHRLSAVVLKVYGDVDGVLGKWNKKYVLKRLCLCRSLGIGKPFLEEGGEGVAVYHRLRFVVPDGNLSVALQW